MTIMTGNSFFASLSRLEAKDAARAIDFVNRFMANPAHPGISLERITSRGGRLWSGRISRDLRAIIYQDGDDWALLHAGHHDAAYRWAERRAVGQHPVTGVLQVVESVDSAPEIERYLPAEEPTQAPLLGEHRDPYLLSLGVPEEWLPTLRKVVNEDQLLVVAGKLDEEVGERLLNLAAGEFVTPPTPLRPEQSPIEHPDVRRRFFVTEDSDELRRALEAPLHRWIAFLHPTQRRLVEGSHNGPVKVTGSAGTGKTVVAMHRARHLARAGDRVLLTSYVRTLCHNVQASLRLLCTDAEREQITVSTVHGQALAFVKEIEPMVRPATAEQIRSQLEQALRTTGIPFDPDFVRAEWEGVIDPQGIRSWPEYRKARRVGRGKALAMTDRKALWRVFGAVQDALAAEHRYDWAGMCRRALELLESGEVSSPFDAVIVDEVQDLTPPALRFLAGLAAKSPSKLMVVGDAGQRIYPGRFSLSRLGIEVRGRSHILRLNYRTTEQIRRAADRVLGRVVDDMDGGDEGRDRTRSLLRGPAPTLHGYTGSGEELDSAVGQVERWIESGLAREAIAIFTRSRSASSAITERLKDARIRVHNLADEDDTAAGAVAVGTMHRAKGLEFKAVLVLGCGREILPSAVMLRTLADPQDREDAIERERRLFYVAMTRARDELAITWHGPPSPFLDALRCST